MYGRRSLALSSQWDINEEGLWEAALPPPGYPVSVSWAAQSARLSPISACSGDCCLPGHSILSSILHFVIQWQFWNINEVVGIVSTTSCRSESSNISLVVCGGHHPKVPLFLRPPLSAIHLMKCCNCSYEKSFLDLLRCFNAYKEKEKKRRASSSSSSSDSGVNYIKIVIIIPE